MTKMFLALAMVSSAAHAATIGQTCTATAGRVNYQEKIYTVQVSGDTQECGRVYKLPVPNGTWRATVFGGTTPHDGGTEAEVTAWIAAQTVPTFPTHN